MSQVIELATRYGRYGYWIIAATLRQEGLAVKSQESRENMEKGRTEGAKEAARTGML